MVEPAGREGAAASDVAGLARTVWWAGLGMVVLAGEQGTKLVKAAIERGKECEPSLTEPIKKAGGGVSHAAGELGTRLKGIGQSLGRGTGQVERLVDEKISKTLSEVAGPIRSQLESISHRIDELNEMVETLRKQQHARTNEG
jgi:poly(hydroxyalkanoate) granule-associated protein